MNILKLYKTFNLIRTCQEQLIKAYHPEDLMRCPIHFCLGQEALATTLNHLLKPEDYVLSHHRSHAYYIAKNCPIDKMIYEFYGRSSGSSSGLTGSQELSFAEKNFHSGTILSGMFGISLGTSYAQKYLSKKGITFTIIGDGGMEEGICYETLNLASLHSIPIIFICENNKFSVHTRITERTKTSNFMKKINSFGVKYIKLDTNNVLDIYKKMKKIVSDVRRHKKPTFIEYDTMRYCAHNGPEDEDAKFNYRPKDLNFWKKKDPDLFFQKKINKKNIKKIKKINLNYIDKIIKNAPKEKFLSFEKSLKLNFIKSYSSKIKKFTLNNSTFKSSQQATKITSY